MKNIAILLIVVSLASLAGLVYPTVRVTEFVTQLQPVTATVPGHSETWTQGLVVQWTFTLGGGNIPELVFTVTHSYGMATHSTTFYPHTYTATSQVTATDTSRIGYASSGTGGTVALFLVVALFLAGVGLLVKRRKVRSPTLDGWMKSNLYRAVKMQ